MRKEGPGVKALDRFEVWLVTGSQGLYGEDTLRQVAEDAQRVAAALDGAGTIPVRVVSKPVVTGPDSIRQVCVEANASPACIGVIAWMHTFSPAKMWIAGLRALQQPLLHLHTQTGRDLPWATIDMDFMNLHQSAHGDREFGFIESRMRVRRKTVVGHWDDPEVQAGIGVWARAAAAWHEAQTLRVARFGDNMREVAVTEGDKVEAQMRLGVSVNTYGVTDLVAAVRAVSDADAERVMAEYEASYDVAPELRAGGGQRSALRDAARIEVGLRGFLEAGGFGAFTDTFEDLGGLVQLPGIAVQRLMADGYGFGGEGDWKAAVLVRLLKTMAAGLPGGTSFMEDYTYHLDPAGPRSPSRVRPARSIPWASAVARTRCASSSTPHPDRPSWSASWTLATGSASCSTRSMSCQLTSPCRSCPSPAPSGGRGPTFGRLRMRGCSPAVRITPRSAWRSTPRSSTTSPRSQVSSSPSSTPRRARAPSARSCAGTAPITG